MTALIVASALAACVDLEPAPAARMRHLTIPIATSADGGNEGPAVPGLDLVSVRAIGGIDERPVRRIDAYEVEYPETVRFVEHPEATVRRALEAELYRRRGFVRTSASGRELSVEVVAFEEVLGADHRAAVALVVRAVDRTGAPVVERVVEETEPIAGADPALVAEALSRALGRAVVRTGDLLAAGRP